MTVSSSRTVQFHPSDGIDGDFVLRYMESNPQVRELQIEYLFAVQQNKQQQQQQHAFQDDDSTCNDEQEQESSNNNNNNNNNDNNYIHNRYLFALDQLLVKYHSIVHLEYLGLPRNGFGPGDGPMLASIVRRQYETLTSWNLSDNPLGSGGIQMMLESLVSSRLVVLNLTSTKLGSKSAATIASLLRRNGTIRELYLGNNDIGTKGMGVLAPDLAANATLQVLDVSYNKLKAKGASVLAKELQNSTTSRLCVLDMTCNRIGATGMQAFARFLSMDKTIERFYVGSNNLGWQGAAMLASVLKVNYKLRDLRLPDNKIEDDGAILIATEGLSENDTRTTAVERLDLSWNEIGEDGALALAEVLRENARLAHLNLTGNQVGCQGTAAFAETLAYNLSLTELVLTKNQMRDEGAFSLALALGKPTCAIQSLSWNENPISEVGMKALARVPQLRNNQALWLGDTLKALAKGQISSINFMNRVTGDEELLLLADVLVDSNPLLRTLWLSGRAATTSRGILPLIERALPSPSNIERVYLNDFSMGDKIAESFGRVLCRNVTLGVLSITDCGMTATGAAALADGLKNNSTLRRLNLDRNNIGDGGLIHLASALPHPSLESLGVCRNNISDKSMALEDLKALQELRLNWNRITNTGALDFCKFLEEGCHLVYVGLRGNAISRIGGETIQKFLPKCAVVEY